MALDGKIPSNTSVPNTLFVEAIISQWQFARTSLLAHARKKTNAGLGLDCRGAAAQPSIQASIIKQPRYQERCLQDAQALPQAVPYLSERPVGRGCYYT